MLSIQVKDSHAIVFITTVSGRFTVTDFTSIAVHVTLSMVCLAVAVTVYVPVCTIVMLSMVMFCWSEVKSFGPVQLYKTVSAIVLAGTALRVKGLPAQTVMSAMSAKVMAGVLTVTLTLAVLKQLVPWSVAVTVYVPSCSAVMLSIVMFCWLEEKLFGPVQL